MLLRRRPSTQEIDSFLDACGDEPFSYPEVGATRHIRPRVGYALDTNRFRLGSGRSTYLRAVVALKNWQAFNIPSVQFCWPELPMQTGEVVALLARHFGFWSLNACRIVYVLEEEGDVHRFGFAYGTLPEHLASGEERFVVEWRGHDDAVWFETRAFSRPNHPLTWLGYPLGRWTQRKIVQAYGRAMARAIHLQSEG